MKVNFNRVTDDELKQKICYILKIAQQELGVKDNIGVNITFVGEKKIRELNKQFRNIDRVTDVLSFPLFEPSEVNSGEMLDPSIQSDIGDIVICKKRAIWQAKEYGHSLLREICFLSLHGFLHVLGYDHIEKDDEKVMFALQDKILTKAKMER